MYLGPVAKPLAPSIRIGGIIAPLMLIEERRDVREAHSSQLATLGHLIVAHLIDNGRYDRHLRYVRRLPRTSAGRARRARRSRTTRSSPARKGWPTHPELPRSGGTTLVSSHVVYGPGLLGNG